MDIPKGNKRGMMSFPKDSVTLASKLSSLICSDGFNFDVKHGAFYLANNAELQNQRLRAKDPLVAFRRLIKSNHSVFGKTHADGIAFDLP